MKFVEFVSFISHTYFNSRNFPETNEVHFQHFLVFGIHFILWRRRKNVEHLKEHY